MAYTLLDPYARESYTLNPPWRCLNPFGTGSTGYTCISARMPFYTVTYTVHVEDESIPDYTAA